MYKIEGGHGPLCPFRSISDHGGVGGGRSREEAEVGGNGGGSAGEGEEEGRGIVVREKTSMVNGTREGGLAVVVKPTCKTMFCIVDYNAE
jgi:hypothetical protein